MNRFLILSFVIFLLFLNPILSAQENQMPKELYGLIGCWQLEESSTFELWELKQKIFHGRVIKIENNDTLTVERLRIYIEQKDIIYEATVAKQNNGKSVKFKLTNYDEKNFTFENPKHDFPQEITYTFINRNKLKATAGTDNKKLTFNYLRTQ